MATDPEKGNTTTFGAIIERKNPSPTKSRPPPPPPPPRAPPSSSSTLTPDFTGSSSTTIRPHLHLSSASQAVDPPLPSPYSFSDAITPVANRDLESGLAVHTPTDPLSQHPLTERDQLSTIPTATLQVPDSSPSRNPSNSSTGRSGEKNLADDRVRECTMWPTAEELRAKAKAEKRAKNPLMRLSKRNRVILSIVVALTIVGAAVGIGVGVSRAYHGEVWAGNGKSMPIQPA